MQSTLSRMRGWVGIGGIVQIICTATLFFLIIVPVAILLATSFGYRLTFDYFQQAILLRRFVPALANTILFAGGSVAVSITVALPLAWIIGRTNTPLRNLFETVFISPLFISSLVTALAWMILLGPYGLITYNIGALLKIGPLFDLYSIPGMIFVNGLWSVPIVFIFTSSALKSMDPSLEEASMLCGASTITTALRVTLPLVTPAILSAGMLTFVAACSRFAIPLVLGRPRGVYVLTTLVYDLATYGIYLPGSFNVACAIAVLLMSLTGPLTYFYIRVLSKRRFFTVTGKGYKTRIVDLGRWRILTSVVCVFSALFLLIIPLVGLLISSFMNYYTPVNPEFGLWNYEFVLFKYPITWTAFRNSFIVAPLGATICIFLTLVVSYVMVKVKTKGARILEFLSLLPVAIPAVVFGLAILRTWIVTPLYQTLWVLIIAYITIYNPYGVRALTSGLRQIHPDLEDASKISGVSWLTTMRTIILPLLMPSLIAGWCLLFIDFLREFTSSLLLSTYGTWTLSIAIHELLSEGSFPLAASLSVMQIAIVFLVILLLRKFLKVGLSEIA